MRKIKSQIFCCLTVLILMLAPLAPLALDAKVFSGIIDVNSTPDLYYFGYGYKKLSITQLNFADMPSVNVYIRNPVVTACDKNYWIQLSDPRSLLYTDGQVFIAYKVAKGRAIFDGHYRITLLEKENAAFDRTFFISGTPVAGQIVSLVIIPRSLTLKKIKLQVLTASPSGSTTLRVEKSAGNNSAFTDALSSNLVLGANGYSTETVNFQAGHAPCSENDLLRITLPAVGPGIANVAVTLVADYTN